MNRGAIPDGDAFFNDRMRPDADFLRIKDGVTGDGGGLMNSLARTPAIRRPNSANDAGEGERGVADANEREFRAAPPERADRRERVRRWRGWF
jgi:hypothetical protein